MNRRNNIVQLAREIRITCRAPPPTRRDAIQPAGVLSFNRSSGLNISQRLSVLPMTTFNSCLDVYSTAELIFHDSRRHFVTSFKDVVIAIILLFVGISY